MYKSLSKNISELKSITYNSADFTVRNIELTDKEKTKAAVITIEGMCDKEGIAIAIINPLINADYEKHKKENLYEYIKSSVLSASELVEIDTFNQVMTFSMSGFAVVELTAAVKCLQSAFRDFLSEA